MLNPLPKECTRNVNLMKSLTLCFHSDQLKECFSFRERLSAVGVLIVMDVWVFLSGQLVEFDLA